MICYTIIAVYHIDSIVLDDGSKLVGRFTRIESRVDYGREVHSHLVLSFLSEEHISQAFKVPIDESVTQMSPIGVEYLLEKNINEDDGTSEWHTPRLLAIEIENKGLPSICSAMTLICTRDMMRDDEA